MGMFDDIEFEMDCPGCGKKVSGFQSKAGPCLLETLKPIQVNNFYSACDNCKGWIEFTRIPPKEINDFDMKFTRAEEKNELFRYGNHP